MKAEITGKRNICNSFIKAEQYDVSYQKFNSSSFHLCKRDVVVKNNIIGVLLLDIQRNKIVMVSQFRIGALLKKNDKTIQSAWLLEIVAGNVDDCENCTEASIREAYEETGLKPYKIKNIINYLVSPGTTNEYVSIYIGLVETKDKPEKYYIDNEDENIMVEILDINYVLEMLNNGAINNSISIIALQWLKININNIIHVLNK